MPVPEFPATQAQTLASFDLSPILGRRANRTSTPDREERIQVGTEWPVQRDGMAASETRIFLPWMTGGPAQPPPPPPTTAPTNPPRPPGFGPTAEIPNEAAVQFSDANDLTAVVVDRAAGEVWTGSHGGGLLRWDIDTGTYTRFTAPLDLPDNRVLALARAPNGRLWIGTATGASYLDPGAAAFAPVRFPDGRALEGPVTAIHRDPEGNTWFGIDLGGVWKLAVDGSWQGHLGPNITVGGASQRRPLNDYGIGPSLAESGPIEVPIVWWGHGCGSVRPEVPEGGFIALIDGVDLPSDCVQADIVFRAQAAGAKALLLIDNEYLPGAYSSRANEVRIPVLKIEPNAGHALRGHLQSGEPVDAKLFDDGAPEVIQAVSTLAVDQAGDLWVGTYDRGVWRKSQATGGWTDYRSSTRIKLGWTIPTRTIGAAEVQGTWPLAFTGEISGDLVWLGEGCPGDALQAEPRDKIALIVETGRCTLADQFNVAEAADATALVRIRLPADTLTGESIPSSGVRRRMPALQIRNADGMPMVERLLAGDPAQVRIPLKLMAESIGAIAIDPAGNRWIGMSETVIQGQRDFGGGIQVIGPDDRLQRFYSQRTEPVPLLALDNVQALSFDDQGDAWVSTRAGVRRLTPRGDGDTRFSHGSTMGGLPDDVVRGSVIDERGELWAATAQGLARRTGDGVWSQLFSERNVPSNWSSSIVVDGFNDLWIAAAPPLYLGEPGSRYFNRFATAAGLGHFSADRRTWHILNASNTGGALPTDSTMALQVDPDGQSLWVGTNGGLASVDLNAGQMRAEPGGARVALRLAQGDPVLRPAIELPFARSAESLHAPLALYGAACPSGGNTLVLQGRIALVERSPQSSACAFFDQLLDAQRSGAVGVLVYVTDSAQTTLQGNLFDERLDIPSMAIPPDLGIALASALGRGDPYDATMLSGPWIPTGGQVPAINDLTIDHEGNLWMARFGSLDRRSPDGRWRNLHTGNSGLGSTTLPQWGTYSLAVDPMGTKWFGGVFGLVHRASPDEQTWAELRDGAGRRIRGNSPVLDIAVDRSNRVWLSPGFYGLWRLSADRSALEQLTRSNTEDGLLSDFVSNIKFDTEGNGWFSTSNGVSRLDADGESWWNYRLPNATALDIDHDGDLWIATGGLGITQLSRRDPGTDCATALPLSPGAVIDTKLSSQSDVDLYAIRVDKPFSRIEITVPDPEQQLDLFLRRSCIGIGSFGRHIGSFGRHIGSFGRHIGSDQRLVFDVLAETGTYYVDVRPRIGTQDKPIPYRLRSGLAPVDLDSRRTLILTDASAVRNAFGLAADDPEYLDWLDGLRALQADSGVAGLLISDLRSQTNDTVRDAYAAWLANDDPARTNALANTLVLALRDWIWERRAEDLPRLQYIVLAGDDRILPHFRLELGPAAPGSGRLAEPDYLAAGGIDPDSTIGLALAEDRVLTDDPYAAPAPTGLGPTADLHVPLLSLGRLVERPAAMSRTIDAFLASQGRSTLQASLVAGSGPFEDAARLGQATLEGTGLPEARRAELVGAAWTAPDLLGALSAEPRQLLLAALPGDHAALAVGDGSRLAAESLPAGPGDAGTLVLSLASHGALNVPGPGHVRARDWPETWLERGAALVGSSGYSYGLEGELQYAEKLQTQLLALLVQGDGRVLGDALVAAKQDYLGDIGSPSDLHAATVAGTLLYGLPMAHLEVTSPAKEPGDAAGQSVWGAEASRLADYTPGRGAQAAREVAPGTWAVRVSQQLETPTRNTGPGGTWYALPGAQPRLEAGEPVQPQERVDLTELVVGGAGGPGSPSGPAAGAAPRSLPVRGLLWFGGRAREVAGDEGPWRLGAIAGAFGAASGRPAAPGDRWQPALPVALRSAEEAGLVGEVLVARRDGRLLYTGGQLAPGGAQWLFDTLETEEYYAAGADRRAPEIRSVEVREAGGGRELSVRAEDASGMLRVVAVWTAGDGLWQALELADDGAGAWRGRMPAGAAALVQGVDRAGNVAVDDREGRLWP